MKPEAVANILEHVLILREIPFDALKELAATLPVESVSAGEFIYKQGAPPESLFILLEGQVELSARPDGQAPESVGKRFPGDLIGDVEMVYRQPRINSAMATEDVQLLRWDRAALTIFMKSHPDALADMQFVAGGHQLARKLNFKWLREGESIYILARKNNFILLQKLSLPILLLLGGIFLGLLTLFSNNGWMTWLAVILGSAGLLTGTWQWIDWSNDYYLVTDWRSVWLEKVVGIYDSRREAPLHTILSVAVNTNMTSRMFSYGDVLIRTYTGKLLFRNISRPHTVAAMIEENWRRLRARQDEADRDALVGALEERLDPETASIPTEDQTLPILTEADTAQDEQTGPRRNWGFRIRFEEGNVITYRKHWAVLMREISLPSILVLFAIGLLGARLGGILTTLEPMLYYLVTLSLLAAGALWWLYRYVDWANDIYQISPDQIIDVYKKPLAREERKVAPIENILGTEVDRKGLVGILLNYGDVIANVGTSQFTFEGVLDPVSVQQDIVHAQEAYLQQKTELDRSRRQGEMVELFDIYHEKYAPGDRRNASEDDLT